MNLYIYSFFIVIIILFVIVMYIRSWQLPFRIKRAEDLFEHDQDSEANEIVKNILEKNKDYVPARYLRAKILAKQNQYIMAISEFKGLFQLSEYSKYIKELELHYRLAELYHKTEQWQKEIEEYKNILTYNPDDINANHRIGHSFYKQKKYKQARDTLLRAVTLDPKLSDCFMPLGIAFFHLTEYTLAEQYLLKAIEIHQTTLDAYYFLGMIYKGKKDYDNAIQMFESSRGDSSFFRQSIFRIGEIYFETGYYDKVIGVLEQGLASLVPREDESLAFRHLLAEAYEMESQIQEAVHHWEKIHVERPNYRNVQAKLDDYRAIMSDGNLEILFTSSLEELQPLISEIIARLNYNVISKNYLSSNLILFKAFNIKRINEPSVLIYFNRSIQEIKESEIIEFARAITEEKCKSGIYITTARLSVKAQATASAKMIEILDKEYLAKIVEKIKGKEKSKI